MTGRDFEKSAVSQQDSSVSGSDPHHGSAIIGFAPGPLMDASHLASLRHICPYCGHLEAFRYKFRAQ